jgi:hypothetical protein
MSKRCDDFNVLICTQEIVPAIKTSASIWVFLSLSSLDQCNKLPVSNQLLFPWDRLNTKNVVTLHQITYSVAPL